MANGLRLKDQWRLTGLVLAVIVLCHSRPLCAKSQSVGPQDVAINYALTTGSEGDLVTGCHELAKRLMVGAGPWGLGFARSATCAVRGKAIDKPSAAPNWLIVLSPLTTGRVSLAIYHCPQANSCGQKPQESQLQENLEFDGPGEQYTSLAQPYIADLLALAVSDALPFAAQLPVGTKDFSGRPFSPPPDPGLISPKPPKSFSVYQLSFDNELNKWLPLLEAQANLQEGPELKWHVEPYKNVSAAQPTALLWLQDGEGVGKRQQALAEALRAACRYYAAHPPNGTLAQALTSALKQQIATGVIGIRLGRQMLPGDALIDGAPLVGLMLELNSGWGKGLRWNLDDFSQRSTSERSGVTRTLSWQRTSVGKAFSLSWRQVAFDLSPRLSLWNFSFRETFPTLPRTQLEMSGHGELGLGLEVGSQWQLPWFLLRGWLGRDVALKAGNSLQSGIAGNRMGLDAYWLRQPSFQTLGFDWSLAFHAFGLVESLVMDDGLGRSGQTLELDQAFLGGGVALSWR